MRKFRNSESLALPDDLDYTGLTWVSAEERLLLTEARPATVHGASRISGTSCRGAVFQLSRSRFNLLPGIRSSTLMLLFSIAKRHAQARGSAAGATV